MKNLIRVLKGRDDERSSGLVMEHFWSNPIILSLYYNVGLSLPCHKLHRVTQCSEKKGESLLGSRTFNDRISECVMS